MLDLSTERIAVTGGAGFLGKYVCRELSKQGARTVLVPLHADYDLTSMADAERMYHDNAPTVVIHLAAEVGGIGANQANPGRYFYANMAMGLNLIEQARIHKLKKFVQVGTVCAYPCHTKTPFCEDDLFNGYPEPTNAPYGIAKRSLLVMLQAYRKQYELNGIYLLPVNLYGPGDNFDPETSHVIPALIRKMVEAKRYHDAAVTLWGTGQATREFLYVTDCARGIVLALQHYDKPEPVNLGTGQSVSIEQLARMIQRATGYTGRIEWDESRPDGQPERRLDTSRARELFGFEAQTILVAGLSETIAWYREHRAGGKIAAT